MGTDERVEASSEIEDGDQGRSFPKGFSGVGLALGTVFFALSLQPSLLPRSALFQGIVSGVTFMIGYGLGTFVAWAWRYVGAPVPEEGSTVQRWMAVATAVVVTIVSLVAIWRHVGWQNDVRDLMGVDPVDPWVWLVIVPVTLIVAGLILLMSRGIRAVFRALSGWLTRVMNPRLARLLGGIAVALLVVLFVSGVLVEGLYSLANSAFETRDTTTNEGDAQPSDPERSGSQGSLSSWESLGRQGRSFVSNGPTVDDLDAYWGGDAAVPVRVYAGLKSGGTIQDRADLVLEELIRTEAFDREILVVATTTGTGFLVPEAMESIEYLLNGDTAIAGVQYSYLPSWLSLLADQQIARDTSQIVFTTVHEYWSDLPEDARPEIYLFGLSLGSFGVESILQSLEIINEPIDGALMTGPPFVNDLWNDLTNGRDEGSPAWLPTSRDGRTVRFTTLENTLDMPTAEWAETRVVYLQHASDPVSFFSPSLALAEPDWLKEGQRGPDVSDDMSWLPIVTMWQVLGDLPTAGGVPAGHGHLFTSGEYLDGWMGITDTALPTAADEEELRAVLAARDAERSKE